MKNLKYFSFERNKYFYGKLLSVDDFETEQRYMNDKRRIVNRFIHGVGVACGMNVIQTDDASISVEMGFALDFAGREIVVEHPVTRKLSMIDGFLDYKEEDEANRSLYLCIEYSETEKEAVHSIAVRNQGENKEEYNKYAEGYHLYLTAKEPEENFAIQRIYKETKILYRGNGIIIRQIVPCFIKAETEFEIKIIVENMGQPREIEFCYELDLNGMDTQDGGAAEVHFDEKNYEKAQVYSFTRRFRTMAVKEMSGFLRVKENSFWLKIGGEKVKAEANGISHVQITNQNIKKRIMHQYYQNAMEDIVNSTYGQSIYLAKISVIRAGETYIIDKVQPMPFEQYLFNNSLGFVMNQLDIEREEKEEIRQLSSQQYNILSNVIENRQAYQFSSGEIVINLGLGGNPGQKFFSDEIIHGLGLGTVNIILSNVCGLGSGSPMIFGEQDIFEREIYQVPVKMAARLDVKKGSFVIGIECLDYTAEHQIRIHWTAIKDQRESLALEDSRSFQIKPDMLNLNVRESYYFEAILQGVNESRVNWSVKGVENGTIDENGMYIAPNQPGIYEIVATSMDYPELIATAFVIVREHI